MDYKKKSIKAMPSIRAFAICVKLRNFWLRYTH
jgi:hypothetical protein